MIIYQAQFGASLCVRDDDEKRTESSSKTIITKLPLHHKQITNGRRQFARKQQEKTRRAYLPQKFNEMRFLSDAVSKIDSCFKYGEFLLAINRLYSLGGMEKRSNQQAMLYKCYLINLGNKLAQLSTFTKTQAGGKNVSQFKSKNRLNL